MEESYAYANLGSYAYANSLQCMIRSKEMRHFLIHIRNDNANNHASKQSAVRINTFS